MIALPVMMFSRRVSKCAMVKVVAILGMGDLPPLNRNPYNGYINPYGLGLMSLSPIIWKYWELIDPGTNSSSSF